MRSSFHVYCTSGRNHKFLISHTSRSWINDVMLLYNYVTAEYVHVSDLIVWTRSFYQTFTVFIGFHQDGDSYAALHAYPRGAGTGRVAYGVVNTTRNVDLGSVWDKIHCKGTFKHLSLRCCRNIAISNRYAAHITISVHCGDTDVTTDGTRLKLQAVVMNQPA